MIAGVLIGGSAPVGILGAVVVAFSLVVLVIGLLKPRRVEVRCTGTTCVVEKVSILRKSSIEVVGLRGATAEEKRRGARDNVRLVLHGEKDVEMGPWTSRGDRNATAYHKIAMKLDTYVSNGSKGSLVESVSLSQTIVLWMVAITLLGIGSIMIAIYFTGSKVEVDRSSGQYFFPKQQGALAELASVEVPGPGLVGTRRDKSEVVLLRTFARKGKPTPHANELIAAADRLRTYLG